MDDYDDALLLLNKAKNAQERGDSFQQARQLYLDALCILYSTVGWLHEDTARTFYHLGWLHYCNDQDEQNIDNKVLALGYLLQAMKISHFLENDAPEIMIMDDIQDVLEEIDQLDIEKCNQIFESWELQQEIEESSYFSVKEGIAWYNNALDLIPPELELERARIYTNIARIERDYFLLEQSLDHYSKAIKAYSKWLSPENPIVLKLGKDSAQVSSELKSIKGFHLPKQKSWLKGRWRGNLQTIVRPESE